MKYKARFHPGELSLDEITWFPDRQILKMLDEKQRKSDNRNARKFKRFIE